jgi:hypothetical protein
MANSNSKLNRELLIIEQEHIKEIEKLIANNK